MHAEAAISSRRGAVPELLSGHACIAARDDIRIVPGFFINGFVRRTARSGVMAVRHLDAWLGIAVLAGAAIVPSCIFWHPTRAYASGKEGRLTSVTHLRRVDRWLRIFTVLGGGAALFRQDPFLLEWYHAPAFVYAGIIVTLLGVALLVASKRALGWNYSPGFDGYVPFRIVEEGPYRVLRHPMYTGRIVIFAGAFIMTGSTWVILAGIVALSLYWHAALLEEVDLGHWFPIYHLYTQRTSRFIPMIRSRARFTAPFTHHDQLAGDDQITLPDVISLTETPPQQQRASSAPDAA
jgi:protein-S-isoprenylcysteine O-methyltransferase Ste14